MPSDPILLTYPVQCIAHSRKNYLIDGITCLGAFRDFQTEVETRAEKDRKRSDVVGTARPLPAQTPAPRKIKGAVYGSDEQVLVDEPDISLQVPAES